MIVLSLGVMATTAVGFGITRVIYRKSWEFANKDMAAQIEKVRIILSVTSRRPPHSWLCCGSSENATFLSVWRDIGRSAKNNKTTITARASSLLAHTYSGFENRRRGGTSSRFLRPSES